MERQDFLLWMSLAFSVGVLVGGVVISFAIKFFDNLTDCENQELRQELKETKRLLRVREEQRDEADDMAESIDNRNIVLRKENERLMVYEQAVQSLSRTIKIAESEQAQEIPF